MKIALPRALQNAPCVFLFALLPFQIGCLRNQLKLQATPPPEISSKSSNNLLTKTWLADYHSALLSGKCPGGSTPTGPAADQCPTGKYADAMQAFRNSYIEAIRAKVDDSYSSFKGALYAGHSYLELGADLAVLGLGGAGSVIADSGLKSILAATSSGVTGAAASFDKQVLNQQNTLAIISTMDAQRASQAVVIVTGEQKSVDDYPIESALVDLRVLQQEGSVVSALEVIQGNAQVVKTKAKADQATALQ